MKKKVAFQKEIEFPTMIGEISAISLEHDLHFVNESNVEGNLLLSGKYKLTEASRLEEDFSYKIPTDIVLTEKLDLNTAHVEIADFYYEIDNENRLICNIELAVDGVEIIDVEDDKTNEEEERNTEVKESLDGQLEEERECDGDDKSTKIIELPRIEKEENNEIKKPDKIEKNTEIFKEEEGKSVEDISEKIENVALEEVTKEEVTKSTETEVKSLFVNLGDEETYGTFLVYIVRQNESINSIIDPNLFSS